MSPTTAPPPTISCFLRPNTSRRMRPALMKYMKSPVSPCWKSLSPGQKASSSTSCGIWLTNCSLHTLNTSLFSTQSGLYFAPPPTGKPNASRISPPPRTRLAFLYGARSSSYFSSSKASASVLRRTARTSHGDVATISALLGGASRPMYLCTPMGSPTPRSRVVMPRMETLTSPRSKNKSMSSSMVVPTAWMIEPCLKYLGAASSSIRESTGGGTHSKTFSPPSLGTDGSTRHVSLSRTASRAAGWATTAFKRAWRYRTITMQCVTATTSCARVGSIPRMLFWKHQSPRCSSTKNSVWACSLRNVPANNTIKDGAGSSASAK
mmetsp:Transcript_101844/g.311487  ORF Transcript_101844/g.311487 Transcript_101844/m.311487 type:complete len:322 (+) Transcript_101844:159-1124(+)